MCDGKLAEIIAIYLCCMWNDGGILWSDKLPDHINSDRI